MGDNWSESLANHMSKYIFILMVLCLVFFSQVYCPVVFFVHLPVIAFISLTFEVNVWDIYFSKPLINEAQILFDI